MTRNMNIRHMGEQMEVVANSLTNEADRKHVGGIAFEIMEYARTGDYNVASDTAVAFIQAIETAS